jgi:hypothetical protein
MKVERMNAMWVTTFVNEWMVRSTAVHILHLFDHVCNVVNEWGEIVSIVSEEVGCGPFAIVVPSLQFDAQMEPNTIIRIDNSSIIIGKWVINLAQAAVWNPSPNWQLLQRQTAVWQQQLPAIQSMVTQQLLLTPHSSTVLTHTLAAVQAEIVQAVKSDERQRGRVVLKRIAGLGHGLTPTGDDFLMGVLYGLWATASPHFVKAWGELVVETAVPLTTTLSAAMLTSAAHGAATAPWHAFVAALVGEKRELKTAVHKILAIGHSSGADAFVGFLAITQN